MNPEKSKCRFGFSGFTNSDKNEILFYFAPVFCTVNLLAAKHLPRFSFRITRYFYYFFSNKRCATVVKASMQLRSEFE